jgi:hypothetical protein
MPDPPCPVCGIPLPLDQNECDPCGYRRDRDQPDGNLPMSCPLCGSEGTVEHMSAHIANEHLSGILSAHRQMTGVVLEWIEGGRSPMYGVGAAFLEHAVRLMSGEIPCSEVLGPRDVPLPERRVTASGRVYLQEHEDVYVAQEVMVQFDDRVDPAECRVYSIYERADESIRYYVVPLGEQRGRAIDPEQVIRRG